MPKINYRPVTGADNLGVAVANKGQITAISNSGLQYVVDAIYVAVPQLAHSTNVTVNNRTNATNRIFVVEYIADDNGRYQPTGNITAIGVNSLTGSNFGVVGSEEAPHILAEKNAEGLWRAVRNQGNIYKRNLVSGVHRLSIVNTNIKVVVPVAFKCLGTKQVYTTQMKETAAGYDFEVMESSEGDIVLNLGTTNATFWEEIPLAKLGITSVPTLKEILPADFPHRDELCVD